MHILVVNDDGPPSRRLSPYIRPFVDALETAGHRVSVAIPAASRSWIGKAHLIEVALTATYVHRDAFREDGTWSDIPAVNGNGNRNHHVDNEHDDSDSDMTISSSSHPSPTSQPWPQTNHHDEWVVIRNGTPASCTQIGLYNLFPDRGPIDLVISGPNHGRNASTIYNLSSGTVGGALEAATCGKRGIAVSFGSKDEQSVDVVRAAARLSVRVIEHLVRNWDPRVELYNLNVPMRADVESRPVKYTRALRNYWSKGSLYAETGSGIEAKTENRGEAEEEMEAGKGHEHANQVNGQAHTNGHNNRLNDFKSKPKPKERHFKWSTELSDIKKSLHAAQEGTDAHTVLNGYTSVTPLLANFWHVSGLEGDLELGQ